MESLIRGTARVIASFKPLRRYVSKRIVLLIIQVIVDAAEASTRGSGFLSATIVPQIRRELNEQIFIHTGLSNADRIYVVNYVADKVSNYLNHSIEFRDIWMAMGVLVDKKKRITHDLQQRLYDLAYPIVYDAIGDKKLIKIVAKELVRLYRQSRGSGVGPSCASCLKHWKVAIRTFYHEFHIVASPDSINKLADLLADLEEK